ncbi:lysophospholipid acyltransferase 7, partial [Pezoporus occidentalis]|uniref:lysophospholipid acyltransferase 7 n=1 Tax=Pezoporus occidentalis TaxID=407982 RepID=UPI002F916683
MVSMATDVQDLREAGLKGVTSAEADDVIGGLESCPGLVEILCYSYCYLGLLTGPFYRLRTYQDWLRGPSPPFSPSLILERLRWVPAFALVAEACGRLFPARTLLGPALWGWSFPWRLLASAPVFLAFRLRFYVGWLCAEAACLVAAFGGYPKERGARPGCGPTRKGEKGGERSRPPSPQQWDFECIRTVDPWGTERCRGVREGLRRWNMTVQWWLQHYVHRRAPGPPLLRASVTLLASAYWHGLHGGLYLSLLSLPLWLAAERSAVPAALGVLPTALGVPLGRALPMRVFEYLSVGFVLRRGGDALRYWGALGFCLHLLPLALMAGGVLMRA